MRGLTGGESHALDFPITCLSGHHPKDWGQTAEIKIVMYPKHALGCIIASPHHKSAVVGYLLRGGRGLFFSFKPESWTWSVVSNMLEHVFTHKKMSKQLPTTRKVMTIWGTSDISSHHISLKTSAQLPIYRGRPWATKISLGGKQVEPVVLACFGDPWAT